MDPLFSLPRWRLYVSLPSFTPYYLSVWEQGEGDELVFMDLALRAEGKLFVPNTFNIYIECEKCVG